MLNSLPASLDETYERMLCNIDSYWIEDAQRMLTMLCFASRPLTVQELIDSVAVETGVHAGLNPKRRLRDLNGIREICGGLVDIFLESVKEEKNASGDGDASEGGDTSVEIVPTHPRIYDLSPTPIVPTVRIAHFSVQEYLRSKRISGQKAAHFGLSSIAAHAEIAEVCLIYLLEPDLSRLKSNQAILTEYPLADFAATYWYYHYRKTENPTSGLNTCILRLFKSQTSFATWVQLHDLDDIHDHDQWFPGTAVNSHSRRVDDVQAPIYYASLLGLDKVLHGLLHSEQVESTKTSAPPLITTPNVSKQTFFKAGKDGGAMHAAAYHGYDHIIRILLDSGFDINDQGGYAKGSALHIASAAGHVNMVQILLDRGADVNAQNLFFGSALQAASGKGHQEIVQILLDRGADVNSQSGKPGGFLEVVQVLLDRGADVKAPIFRNDSALQAASISGHKEILQILLDRGADVNAQSGGLGSALHMASASGYKEIVQILLDRGADVNARSGSGTALCMALEWGRGDNVRILLDRGARISIGQDRALKVAVRKGHPDVVQMLLNGMNAEDFDNEWERASSSRVSFDNIRIMKLLRTHDFPFRHKPSITEQA